MAVPISNVTRRQVYAPSGSGGAGPYAFTFEILANTDIAVYKDDTLLTLTTHYTVTINANGTGSVTITAAGLALSPTSPTQYAIVGNRTISRSTDFTTGGDFFANVLNDELDQQTIFAQQNAEGLQRALSAPQTDPTNINMTLPRTSDRAGRYLAFDSSGNPTVDTDITVVYQGAKASDPTVRNDGAALQTGDMYFNSVDANLRAYTGTAWIVAVASMPQFANGGGELGLRNYFMNGNFKVRQRGTSFTPAVGGINYTADRWYYTATGAAPASINFYDSGRLGGINIAGASGLTKLVIGQRIEAANHVGVYNSPVAISFFAFPATTKTLTVYLREPTSVADDFSATTVLASASVTLVGGVLNSYSVTFSATGLSAVRGLEVVFDFGAVGAGDSVIFGRAQIEKTDITSATAYVTSFDHRPYGLELALCQRYLPAWNGAFGFTGSVYSTSTTQTTGTIAFPVETRVPPTGITTSSPGHFRYQNATSAYAASAVSFVSASTKNGWLNFTVTGVASANLPGIMDCNNASGQLLFTGCEL